MPEETSATVKGKGEKGREGGKEREKERQKEGKKEKRKELVHLEEFSPNEKHQKVGRNPLKKM